MASPEERLGELGITLPGPTAPLAAYVSAVRAGGFVFVSGTLPMKDGQLAYKGKLGAGLSIEQGYAAARQAIICALGSLRAEIGSLDRVRRIVRIEGHVASAEGFTDQAKVINGASELLAEVFGEAGKHSRVALGANELPLGTPVEIAMVVEVEPN